MWEQIDCGCHSHSATQNQYFGFCVVLRIKYETKRKENKTKQKKKLRRNNFFFVINYGLLNVVFEIQNLK